MSPCRFLAAGEGDRLREAGLEGEAAGGLPPPLFPHPHTLLPSSAPFLSPPPLSPSPPQADRGCPEYSVPADKAQPQKA